MKLKILIPSVLFLSFSNPLWAQDIQLDKLQKSEASKVCKNIVGAANHIIIDHQFSLAAGYNVAQLAKGGNWEFKILQRGGSCLIAIDVSGVYQGNSYNKTITCGVRTVTKNSNGKYIVKYLALGGGFDEGCYSN